MATVNVNTQPIVSDIMRRWFALDTPRCRVLIDSLIVRLPGTLVPGRPCFTADVFFPFFIRSATSELRRPIAAKLCHMIAMRVFLIMQVQKFGGPSPQRNWGPKTSKIRRDFRQLQNSIANISGTGQDIQNRKAMWWSAIPPAFHQKSPVNFGPLTTENCMSLNPPKLHFFRETISRPLGSAGPSNFRDSPRLASEHP